MTNNRKEPPLDDRDEASEDSLGDDAAKSDNASPPAPNTAAPILQSEDDELFDEDAPQ